VNERITVELRMRNLLHFSRAVMLSTGTLGGRFLLALGLACLVIVPAQADENEVSSAAQAQQLQWITAEGRALRPKNESDALEMIKLRWGRRMAPLFSGCCGPLDRIGNLSGHRFWKKVLPLSKAQADAITKLDNLVQEARDLSIRNDADHPADDLASYQAYLDRNHTRRQAAIRHAQRMVDLGLLTEPQAAFVLQRWITTRRRSYAMYNEHVQELLGMTASQKEEMVHIAEHFRDELVSPALWKILTPSQQETWLRLTAKRTLPAEPPNLPSSLLIDADAAGIKLADHSPTFRVLADNPRYTLGTSAYQTRLLNDLVELTRIGLWWISLGHRETRDEFLKHAEQVALLGILTEEQSERVQVAIKGN